MSNVRFHTLLCTLLAAPLGCGSLAGGDGDGDGEPIDEPTTFTVRVVNESGGAFPTPLSPVAWAIHGENDPIFTVGAFDRDLGLEALAEDGNPMPLASALAEGTGVVLSALFNLPSGELMPGPIFSGGEYAFTVEARPGDGNLSLATMLVQTNDVFVAPDGAGIPLFDADGQPIAGERDVTDHLVLWEAGTEANQAPGFGPDQAPRQAAANTGASEGSVRNFSDATRALPLAGAIAHLSVTENGGGFVVSITNASAEAGAVVTPIAPVFYAVHNDEFSLFTAGQADRGQGLESLAEDGSPAALVASHTGARGTLAVGAQTTTLERPTQAGAAMPGETFEFTVVPDAAHPMLTIAAMVVQSNDAFLAFPTGLRLLESDGSPRTAAAINGDIARLLAVWDAGTEINEIPGAGVHQVLRQAAANSGPADSDNAIRLYRDAANDLSGPLAGQIASISITASSADPMTFDVVVGNRSALVGNALILTPIAFAVHDEQVSLFTTGERASLGLETLAETGNPMVLRGELAARSGVALAGVQAVGEGAQGPGPIGSGGSYRFSVTMDASHRHLSIATMIVPSNDTFLAFGDDGLELIADNGLPRSDAEIAADLAQFVAWDAGTEANQAGAAGRDQAPRQASADAGAREGNRRVRSLTDPVWAYPAVNDVLRVTVSPVAP